MLQQPSWTQRPHTDVTLAMSFLQEGKQLQRYVKQMECGLEHQFVIVSVLYFKVFLCRVVP